MPASAVIDKDYALSAEIHLYTITSAFTGTYSSNGETFNATGNRRFEAVWAVGGQKGFSFEFDAAAQKMKVFYSDYNASGDGALIEVPNATDITTLTAVKFAGIGA